MIAFGPTLSLDTNAQSPNQCQIVVMVDEPQYHPDTPSIGGAWTVSMTLSTENIFPSSLLVNPINEDSWSYVPQSFPHVAFNEIVRDGNTVELQALASVERELLNDRAQNVFERTLTADCSQGHSSQRIEVELEVTERDGPTDQNLTESWDFETWVAILPAS